MHDAEENREAKLILNELNASAVKRLTAGAVNVLTRGRAGLRIKGKSQRLLEMEFVVRFCDE